METILFSIWATGWIASTIFAAAVIGNVENYPGDTAKSFPAFVFPLFFGWSWPAVLAVGLIVAPLAWLSDRATDHSDPEDEA